MSHYLSNLAATVFHSEAGIQPRLPGPYEPQHITQMQPFLSETSHEERLHDANQIKFTENTLSIKKPETTIVQTLDSHISPTVSEPQPDQASSVVKSKPTIHQNPQENLNQNKTQSFEMNQSPDTGKYSPSPNVSKPNYFPTKKTLKSTPQIKSDISKNKVDAVKTITSENTQNVLLSTPQKHNILSNPNSIVTDSFLKSTLSNKQNTTLHDEQDKKTATKFLSQITKPLHEQNRWKPGFTNNETTEIDLSILPVSDVVLNPKAKKRKIEPDIRMSMNTETKKQTKKQTVPNIRVTIGRIEIRAETSSQPAQPLPPKPSPRRKPVLGLDQYLQRRKEETR